MKVDVLGTMDHAIRCVRPGVSPEHAEWHRQLTEARAAIAELIERDKEAQQVFDCILRGVNDTSGDMGHRSLQYVPSWLESWAKSMLAAGFKPSNPDAGDIKRAIAKVQP